jgi:hypothetical protein
MREKFGKCRAMLCSIHRSGDHDHVGREFVEDLSTSATGSRWLLCIGDDNDGNEATLTLGDSCKDGIAFSTDGESVRGVLDIAAGMKAPFIIDEDGADTKL